MMLKVNDYFWVRSSLPNAQQPGTTFRNQKIRELGPVSSDESALILLLSGFADVLDSSAKVAFRQRLNLGVFGAPPNKRFTNILFSKNIAAIGIDIDLVDKYLQNSHTQRLYYKEILLEVIHFFYRSRLGQHTMAFLHLYRMLERVAFVFPITYAISSDDFRGTYDSFKSYVSGGKGGELNFFSKFQNHAVDDVLLDAPTLLDFSGIPFGGEARSFRLVKQQIDESLVTNESNDLDITIKSRGLVGLMINLRNRFFHASSDHLMNVTLIQIADPDLFFSRVNGAIVNWMSILYFITLRSKSERYKV
jgi:hypothetical protein